MVIPLLRQRVLGLDGISTCKLIWIYCELVMATVFLKVHVNITNVTSYGKLLLIFSFNKTPHCYKQK